MASKLYDLGEQAILDLYFNQNRDVEVGLYDDSTDQLLDDAVFAGITTEPADGNYARKTFNLANDFVRDISTGNVTYKITSLTWDVQDTTGTVDSYFVRDASNGNLLWTGLLNESKLLDPIDELDQNQIGISLG
jgi:hypothetical protein